MPETENQTRLRLPCAAYDLAIRLGVKPQDDPSSVKLTQTGRMKREIGWTSRGSQRPTFNAGSNIGKPTPPLPERLQARSGSTWFPTLPHWKRIA
jgi:hypothetical protein